MGWVRGESGASASSTNSCGTGLRCLTGKRGSSSGCKAVLRRGFDMGSGYSLAHFAVAAKRFRISVLHPADVLKRVKPWAKLRIH